ncbi:MFS transporter, CP family, cyanate transporter [Geodermatophilus telluris]|uniref:MFS transporter, CP family, cyanate transporter n=1 Tax=Geodermatophilus telluris TaxID=1190417 RepID=A0A1G6J9T3_9ACTN|nr:MFS transporter [Geodermatophilus telluris]SDC15135.1 MFS transporter, CP family, cyanate transporter [Geodermatophilus telluris]
MDHRDGTTAPARARLAGFLLVAAVVAVALNQRPAVVAPAPLLGDLRADTGLSAAAAGLLTTLPVLCFGAFAPLAPRLARRIGLETAVAASLVLLAAGIALRLLPPVALLYAGSLLAGASIALANVLLPAYVKREFTRPGTVMGLYSASLNVGAAAGAGLTVPLGAALGLGWRGALALWLLLALAALALWLPVAGTGRSPAARAAAGDLPPGGAWALLRVPLAVQVTAFLGLQSVQFYAVGAWLPTLLADAGIPVGEGGLMLALANGTGAVGALVLPAVAGRTRGQRPLVAVVVVAYVVGLTGLTFSPGSGTLLWVALFGVAQGGGFALALTLVVLRSAAPLTAARLGGVAQCLGYLLASLGPVVLGVLHDLTGGWTWPCALLLVLVAPMAVVGWGAARDAVVDPSREPEPEPAAGR